MSASQRETGTRDWGTRLQQVSASQRERLARKSCEERQARIEQMTTDQCDRLDDETTEERLGLFRCSVTDKDTENYRLYGCSSCVLPAVRDWLMRWLEREKLSCIS